MEKKKKTEQPENGCRTLESRREIEELKTMTVRELAIKYYEIFGETTNSRNKSYLVKRIAYRIQEKVEGGLSKNAMKKIEELAKEAPIRRRGLDDICESNLVIGDEAQKGCDKKNEPPDPRLPPVGDIVSRRYKNKMHEVEVLEEGFEYQGRRYNGLSTIAKEITGTDWNGFRFFGLTKKSHQKGAHEDVR